MGPVPGAQVAQATPNGAAFDAALQAAQGQAQQAPGGVQTLVVPVAPEPVAQADNLTQIVTDALRQAATAQAANGEAVQPEPTAKAEPGARKAAPGEHQVELTLPGIGEANQAAKAGEPVPVAPVFSVAREVRADGRHQSETRTVKPAEPSLQNVAFPTQAVRAGETQHKPLEQIPTPIDPQQLMDAIGQAMSTARPGRYTVTLQLYPESLGEVRLQMQVVGREVHAAMQVTNPAAQQTLEDQGDRLRQSLSQAGLTLSGFNVSTGPGSQTPQDRRDQLQQQLASQRRSGATAPVPGPDRPAVQRLGRDRTGGVLDTLA
jgi:flagellar hook-length control protein FliK